MATSAVSDGHELPFAPDPVPLRAWCATRGMLAPPAMHVVLATLSLVASGCYHPMRTLETPAERLAWLGELGVGPRAATPAPSACEGALDEAAIVRLVRERDPEAAALVGEARFLEASADASEVRSPQLRFNNLRYDEVVANEPRFELGLRVPFERPGTLTALADAKRHEALALRARAEEATRKAVLDVRIALARRAAWKAIVHNAEWEETLATAEYARLGAAIATRQVSKQELAAIELVTIEAQGATVRARAEVGRWESVVIAAVGACMFADEDVEAWASPPPDLPLEREALVTTALSERPTLKRSAALAGLADARVWEAKAAAWPWLDWAQLGYELTSPAAADTWSLSLAIDLPIGQWDGAHVAAAETEVRAVREQARREAALVTAEVDGALAEWRACMDEVERLAALRKRADAGARIDELDGAVKMSLADPADLFSLRRDLARIERRRLEALLDLREARARLLAALAR